ncbi:MAG: carbamoyl phosphate synthase small subunit [Acutalibacteraceae bacterium]|nr:carbamoyl phosphate synthase small subunit [Acutalibacteraceae bacterium]
MSRRSFLILENGKVFEGKGFGAEHDAVGELVFTTAMTGYLETITDPSYFGQVIVQTFPLIGNYGVIPADFESNSPELKAYIVRNRCQEPSNFRCEGILDTFLKDSGIPGLYDVDTRAITRIVREYGVMNCKITSTLDNLEKDLEEIRNYKITDAVKSVSQKEVTQEKAENPKCSVALWDFGAKAKIQKALLERGCNVTVFPCTATSEEILAINPDGIMLSNGPGDPAENVEIIENLKKLCEKKIPTFGICLGHQLLALAKGATTQKLKYGHRGANQPATEIETGKVFVTSQNHGYAVVAESLPENAKVSFTNANDGTCEGVTYTDMPAFSVQFHPEACGGPLDTSFLFDRFVAMIEENK